MFYKIIFSLAFLSSTQLLANKDKEQAAEAADHQKEKVEIIAKDLAWTETRSARSAARTIASTAGLGLVGASGAMLAAASLPAVVLTATAAACAGGAYRFFARVYRKESQFRIDQNGALSEALKMNPDLFGPTRKSQNGFDLKRSDVFIDGEQIRSDGEVYEAVFNALKDKIRGKSEDDENFVIALRANALDTQIGLVLEATGQLYAGGAAYESIFHTLPALGQSRKKAIDYKSYLEQDPTTAVIPANTQEQCLHSNKLSITRDTRNKIRIVLEADRSVGLRLGGSTTKMPYELDVKMIMIFTIDYELPAGSPLVMPIAEVSYKLRPVSL